LSKKLFEAETGAYGAGKEKQALKTFADKLRDDVSKQLEAFLMSSDAKCRIGLITLDEISNTKATLFITELYLTCLLHFARDQSSKCPRVLIVVEEAHTVMPEPSTMGLGDHDSRGLVSKISQIALQGRKYGVGLLVIAQRTATVSKSVLTQCNTVISLNSFDETSLGFLANFYGEGFKAIIPNLPRLHAVVFGKAVRSERPVVVEIPFVAEKASTKKEAPGPATQITDPAQAVATKV
jgi:DNA helicase HerA-like ATPase